MVHRRRRRRRRRRRPPGFGKWAVIGFYYEIGASGVRGSIRLVFRVPKVILKILKFRTKKTQISTKSRKNYFASNNPHHENACQGLSELH